MEHQFDYSDTFPALGTANTIFSDIEHREAVRAARSDVLSLHKKLNVFDENSEIAQINKNTGIMMPVSRDTFKLLKDSLEFERLTDGAFKISTLPAGRIWRLASSESRLPTADELISVQKLVQYDAVRVDSKRLLAGLRRHGQKIDLGGIAKGYAADSAAKMLDSHGVKRFMLNFGGSVVTHGVDARVGIRNPFIQQSEKLLGYLKVKDCAVVTSGIYERGVEIGGKRYHHIIDPCTCRPSDSELVSVTLVGNKAEELDALATAVLVMGSEKGSKLLQRLNINAVFVDKRGNICVTNGLKNVLEVG